MVTLNDLKESMIEKITKALIWCIKKLNTKKDTSLSIRLHALANEYNKKPKPSHYSFID